MALLESKSKSPVALQIQSTETCNITARNGLTRSTVTFISIELDSRADHFVRSQKSSLKSLRPSTSKKLASELCDVQLAETCNCRAHIDPSAADIVRPRKSSHRDQRSTSTGHTTKLESPLEDESFLQRITLLALRLSGPIVLCMMTMAPRHIFF